MTEPGVEEFRAKAAAWLEENMPRRVTGASIYGWQTGEGDTDEAAMAERARTLQRRLFDGGYAGIAYPTRYGGRGLTPAHARAFNDVGAAYELPLLFGVTLGVVGPTLLDHATDDLLTQHIPAMLRGEELWVQLLSEPTSGSDLASATTRAVRNGDGWTLTGAKMWTTGAHYSDYGLCLARTDWDAPKHQGLSVFAVPLDADGLSIHPVKQSTGQTDFCQEFFEGVRLAPSSLVGMEGQGWSVVLSHLRHERAGSGGGGIMGGLGGGLRRGGRVDDLIALARESGAFDDADVRQLIAEVYAQGVVHGHLVDRVTAGMSAGHLPDSAGALLKLFWGVRAVTRCAAGLEIAGVDALSDGAGGTSLRYGPDYVGARVFTIAGGTDEMQKNIIGERLLGLPKEHAVDRSIPFREVRTNVTPRAAGTSW